MIVFAVLLLVVVVVVAAAISIFSHGRAGVQDGGSQAFEGI